jgi:hypothetical protein
VVVCRSGEKRWKEETVSPSMGMRCAMQEAGVTNRLLAFLSPWGCLQAVRPVTNTITLPPSYECRITKKAAPKWIHLREYLEAESWRNEPCSKDFQAAVGGYRTFRL